MVFTSTNPLNRTDLVIMPSTLSDAIVDVDNCPGSSPLFMGTNVGPLYKYTIINKISIIIR